MPDLAATDDATRSTATPGSGELELRLEQHRVELTGYCYRMLGSAFEAEDAVQETLVRAWRGFDRFEGRSALRSWLYRIATNVCLDMLNGRQRRARPMDLASPSTAESPLGAALPEVTWIEPIPDGRVLPADGDPAELAVSRETVRLAFVAALQQLPPRQRAVLILREVLAFSAAEVAGLLDTTVASANSALQRARATIRTPAPPEPLDAEHRDLLARYVDAFEHYDIAALTALLHEDATTSMPPFTWWLRGRADIAASLAYGDGTCENARLLPTSVNGSPAFGQYMWTGTRHEPMALVTLEVSHAGITELTTHLDLAGGFARYGLPESPTD